MSQQEIKKPVALISIFVYEDSSLQIRTDMTDKQALRNIIKAAEEIVIQDALKRVSTASPKIVPVTVMPDIKAN